MTAKLTKILDFIDTTFSFQDFDDSSLNGLQVEASEHVTKIGATVDFSDSTLNSAINQGVDLLITHHGMLWGSSGPITGEFGARVRKMISHKVNLIGIHLPLDAHDTFGNNVIIAKDILELEDREPAVYFGKQKIGYTGSNHKNLTLDQMVQKMYEVPGALSTQTVLRFGPKIPQRVCVVSGAAADALYQFKNEKFDTLITGEPRQFAYHFCKENNLNAIFAGHYATETFGVRTLAEHLSQMCNIQWTFIDEPTGI